MFCMVQLILCGFLWSLRWQSSCSPSSQVLSVTVLNRVHEAEGPAGLVLSEQQMVLWRNLLLKYRPQNVVFSFTITQTVFVGLGWPR